MSGLQTMLLGVVFLAAYVGLLVYLDGQHKAQTGIETVVENPGLGWVLGAAQFVLVIAGHFFLVVGAVQSILGLGAVTHG